MRHKLHILFIVTGFFMLILAVGYVGMLDTYIRKAELAIASGQAPPPAPYTPDEQLWYTIGICTGMFVSCFGVWKTIPKEKPPAPAATETSE
jgi:hypothetical protein